MPSITAIGEPLVEISELSDGSEEFTVSGDVVNLLGYAARLGVPSRLMTRLGGDRWSEEVRSRLERRGIDLSDASQDPHGTTGLYRIGVDDEGRAWSRFDRSTSAARELLRGYRDEEIVELLVGDEPGFVTLSGISVGILHESERLPGILREVSRRGGTICFDVNYRDTLFTSPDEARRAFAPFLDVASILFLSEENRRELWPESSIPDIAETFAIPLLVHSRGADGAQAFVDGRLMAEHRPPSVADPVDTLGAGDALAGCFLAAYAMGQSIDDALQLAVKVSSGVVGFRGALSDDFLRNSVPCLFS